MVQRDVNVNVNVTGPQLPPPPNQCWGGKASTAAGTRYICHFDILATFALQITLSAPHLLHNSIQLSPNPEPVPLKFRAAAASTMLLPLPFDASHWSEEVGRVHQRTISKASPQHRQIFLSRRCRAV
jgi:hypothetical protein